MGHISESKYYTPKLEEFRVGFEYEVFQKGEKTSPEMMSFMPIETEDKWYKYSWPDPFFGYHLDRLLKREIRVKYLDHSDIESCGFEISEEWTVSNILGFKIGKIKDVSLSCDRTYDKWIILFSNKYPIKIMEYNGNGYPYDVFYGKIRNANELRQVLDMIGVEYER